MNPELPDDVVSFSRSAARHLQGLGGVQFALATERQLSLRDKADAALAAVGARELDPRGEFDEFLAAAELCRIAGGIALPIPIAEELLARGGDQVGLIDPNDPRIDHGDFGSQWRASTLDGRTFGVTGVARRPGRLGPFIVAATLGDEVTRTASGDIARLLVLNSWRILGAVQEVLRLAQSHVSVRTQFGKPLSHFQAVQFAVSDATVAVAGLSELCRFTAWRLATTGARTDESTVMADALALRLHAGDTAIAVMRASHQLLGAIGFCDEHDVSVLDRHTQPLIRLPFASETFAEWLFPAVKSGAFETLFS